MSYQSRTPQLSSVERPQGGQPGNRNALRAGTHSDVVQRARRLARLDRDGSMPEVPVSRAAWARLFGTDVRAVEMAERRLAVALADQEGLPFHGLPSLGPLARQRLAILSLLRRATTAGVAYAHLLYQGADPAFFEHVRLLARDEVRISGLEKRVVEDLADAAARGPK